MDGYTWEEAVRQVAAADGKEAALVTAYGLLRNKFYGSRLRTPFSLYQLLWRNPKKLWQRNGYLMCVPLNRLLLSLLIASGKFDRIDLRKSWTQIMGFSPHQYVMAQIAPERWMAVDVWAWKYGIQLGDHAHGFHFKTV
jgi:hypothetical protein